MVKNFPHSPNASWTKVKIKSSKSTSNQIKTAEQKNKRLVITLEENIPKFDSYEFREKINSALKTAKCDVQMVTITKSVSGKNIVMITVESNTTDQLIQHRSIWNNIIRPKYVVKDKIWHQFIVNYVHVERFSNMKTLQNEIETYNNVKLKFASRGLSKKIDNKMHSSIVVIVSSNDDAEIIKSGLNIGGIRCKPIKFNSIQPFTQCMKCQKFGHVQTTCKNESKCETCAQKHETNQYICNICKSKNYCTHIFPKCANCNESHITKSTNCEIFLALRAKNAPINVEDKL